MQFSNDYENTLDKGRKGLQVEMSHLGVSAHPGRHQLGELRTTISKGAKHIELGWFGSGKGSIGQGNLNPEVHGLEEREAMRQLAKINKVTLSTHASMNIGSLSGMTQEGFSKSAQENTKHEIDRALGFAADVAGGGPVVVHVGEFQRPIFEATKEFNSPDAYFEATKEESKTAPIMLVDKETGRIKQLPRNTEILMETSEIDKTTGLPKLEKKSVYTLIEEKRKAGFGEKEAPIKVYEDLVAKQLELARGEIGRAVTEAKVLSKRAEVAKEAVKIAESGKPEDIKKARIKLEESGLPTNIETAKVMAENFEQEAKHHLQIANSKQKELLEINNQIKNTETIYEYGTRQSAEAIADEAVKAFRLEKEKNLKEPLWIAVENWDPNLYGSHPKELRKLIETSREEMTKRLKVEQNMSESQAKNVAADHIKATFDIGHANFWRKYFKGKPEDFNKWLLNEVKDLQKDGIIGHVHLSDNFGWHDEHLTPGMGNAPINEFVDEIIKGKDWKGKMIIEPGGQPEGLAHTAMTGTWRQLNTPIYRIDSSPTSWTEIESSYFNLTGPAVRHVVGEYTPFKDWSSWSSEIPLE